jgi:pimeloyl-ACP methyl ester carboxylesterase
MPEIIHFVERTFIVQAGGHNLQVMSLDLPGTPKGGEATLVFLHEGLGSIGQWRDFPRQLADATGLGALVYDRYGFGGSDPLRETRNGLYLQQEAHETLPQVLKSCGVDRPILIGHSDGGTIALLYAARFPGQPRGVITEAAHVFIEEVTLTGIREAVTAFETGSLREKLERYHGERTDSMFRGWSKTWLEPEFREWTMEECLAEIRCPVLAIQGENDEYGTVAQVQAIAGLVAGSGKLLLIPGCGHIPHQQAQERVLREMTRFVDGLK